MRTMSSHAALALFTLSLAAGCGLENSIVGGRCRDGMVLSGASCIEPGGAAQTDPPRNVGDDVVDNKPLVAIVDHVPGPTPPFPTVFEPELPVPSLADPPVPELHCEAPLVECRGACIAVDSDAANCGACGKICPSNICINGECQGATPGDVVLIGHDFTNANFASAQAKVLINALTIPTTDPIRILSFEDGASPQAVAQMKSLAALSIKGRKVKFTRARSASSLRSTTLASAYDIVIINDASAVDPVTTGASWAGSLGTFTVKGGVVLAIDHGTSPMPQLLSSAGLLTVASHTALAEGTHLMVSAAADVIGAQVLSPYACFGAPVSFQGLAIPSDDLEWVVRVKLGDGSPGDAVVVHRIVR